MSVYPAKLTLTAWRGATYRKTMTIHSGDTTAPPWDLTGCSAVLTIVDGNGSTLKTLDNSNGGIILGGTDGTVQIYIPAVDTSAASWNQGTYQLQLIHPNGDIDTLLYGVFRLKGPNG